MGYALAQAALDAGATVTLVSGPTNLAPPAQATFVPIVSAAQLLDAVDNAVAAADIFFSVAAVADYTPAAPAGQKLKKADAMLTLNLQPTVDVLARVAARPNPPFCVGFAAESEDVVAQASAKRERKKIPVMVANHATTAIGADTNEVTLIDAGGAQTLGRAPKAIIARQIIEYVAARLPQPAQLRAVKATKSSPHA